MTRNENCENMPAANKGSCCTTTDKKYFIIDKIKNDCFS